MVLRVAVMLALVAMISPTANGENLCWQPCETTVSDQSRNGVVQELRVLEQSFGSSRLATVTYQEAGVTTLLANVKTSEDRIEVSGEFGETTFSWVLERSPARTTRRVGDAFLELDLGRYPSDDDLDRLAVFEDHLDGPDRPIVVSFAGFVERVAHRTPRGGLIFALLAARGAGAEASLGPIGEYLVCLRDACTEAGGCWNQSGWAGCRFCPGARFFERAAVSFLYNIGAEICFFQLISPIR